eukprot:GHVT01097589.1.p1 GENE.GHVT01097589.1~~GHVT01097589.1.p1  ORF type:complete len:254 (+),score=37.75 GHVT01097589.1:135-896(+)
MSLLHLLLRPLHVVLTGAESTYGSIAHEPGLTKKVLKLKGQGEAKWEQLQDLYLSHKAAALATVAALEERRVAVVKTVCDIGSSTSSMVASEVSLRRGQSVRELCGQLVAAVRQAAVAGCQGVSAGRQAVSAGRERLVDFINIARPRLQTVWDERAQWHTQIRQAVTDPQTPQRIMGLAKATWVYFVGLIKFARYSSSSTSPEENSSAVPEDSPAAAEADEQDAAHSEDKVDAADAAQEVEPVSRAQDESRVE